MKVLGMSLPIGTWGFKRRHWLFIIALLIILAAGLYFFAFKTDAYETAEDFARNDHDIAMLIGTVSKVSPRYWDGFHVTYSGSGGDAGFVLNLKAEREEAILDVRLIRIASSWQVTEAYLSTKIQKMITVLPKKNGAKKPER